jgi:membrane fusion protein (multidrug efflux system)
MFQKIHRLISRVLQTINWILMTVFNMSKNKYFTVITGVIIALVLIGSVVILNHNEGDSSVQITDDAYLQADFTVVSPQVSGVISSIKVDDYQYVNKGEPLLTIDDRDFQISVEHAQAKVESLRAIIEGFQAQLTRQSSVIQQAKSTVEIDKANTKLAEENLQRYNNLAKDGSGTLQAKQEAENKSASQQATLERDQAALKEAGQQVAVLNAEVHRALADFHAAEKQLAMAQLHLSYTQITAPISGVVAQRQAREGGYAHEGQPVITIIPLEAIYVEASFRETQLEHIKIGQPVNVTIDALPHMQLTGHISSLGPASGVSLSPMPAHNATGNFTKIVQRLPVRIQLEPLPKAALLLRVGMSARIEVDVRK